MAPELSSNWKILQARLKAASASKPATSSPPANTSTSADNKKRKLTSDDKYSKTSNKRTKTSSFPKKPPPKTTSTTNSKGKMGAVSSQPVTSTAPLTNQPSIQFLRQNHGISRESLTEAYNLATSPSLLSSLPSHPNQGLSPTASLDKTKYLAIDCEMVGIGPGGIDSSLARVSITDFHGTQVYDSYVLQREKVTDWRTAVSGIAPKHMRDARSFSDVQSKVAELLKGRIVVGHDVKHDLRCLELDHPAKMIRDTAKFSGFKKYGNGPKPALRVLAKELLGLEIQTGQHSSIEDARVAMLLFRKHKPAFDMEHANRYPEDVKKPSKGGKGKKSKRK
ncbi:ribonuclease H-like domain-containing protein [Triangularia verruculosa]|uniref:RNA exonuclease 4 n=1 Tax=Triangularia verruculosa TaxID=2587418 RepID=A0AAN7AY65_9PEZI|nr:ribonuclease H-like domain-containing protein [Triangularia verruculosa]